MRALLAVVLCVFTGVAADYRPPAGERPAMKRPGSEATLPGGRHIAPLGRQYQTGPEPWGLAVSPNGKRVVSADAGTRGVSLTLLDRRPDGWRIERKEIAETRETNGDSQPEFPGVAFGSNEELYASEGNSGVVQVIDIATGKRKQVYNLNGNGFSGSNAGDLVYDAKRRLLFIVDRANSRVAIVDTRKQRVVSSIRTGAQPNAVTLSPDGNRAYVASRAGDGLEAINVENPAAPKLVKSIPTGRASAVAAQETHIYVASGDGDFIAVVNAKSLEVEGRIQLAISGLENLRGVLPLGLALDGSTLYVAEAGINAVGVVDLKARKVIGHLPAGWFPTRIVVQDGLMYVANAKGNGSGPNASLTKAYDASYANDQLRGTISIYPVPDPAGYARNTSRVYHLNGFAPAVDPPKLPAGIQHVVVILKGNRTYDEIFGDVVSAANAPANGAWDLARFGQYSDIIDEPGALRQRLSLRNINSTPNHHALAEQFAFSDNFYADPEMAADGRGWFSGSLWEHLERNNIPFRSYGSNAAGTQSLPVSDQARANSFISDFEKRHIVGKEPLPGFVLIHLPNDRTDKPRPEDGYPYRASFVADNDFALGRIVQFLSRTPWWRRMAIFITESDARGGVDHVDVHRTLLMVASPYARKNYVSKTNANAPTLLKTAFRLLNVPSVNLFDATASDLSDCFVDTPDFTPYTLQAIRPELFDPSKVRIAKP